MLYGCGQTKICDRESVYLHEHKFLSESYSDLSENYYQVKIFDGYIRVPNRFFLNGRGIDEGEKSINLNSVSYIAIYDSYIGCTHKKIMPLIGTISIGNVADCGLCKEGDKDTPDRRMVKEINRSGLRVRIFKIKIPKMEDKQIVLIDNEKEYLSVSDDNEKLWESILILYKTILCKD